MKKLKSEIAHFFQNQGYGIVATVDRSGWIHSACKGIVEVDPAGQVFLFDLYRGQTYRNLLRNPSLSLTSIDEHSFSGYCLKGPARILEKDQVSAHTLKLWEDMLTRRLTRRIVRNLREDSPARGLHPEALLPAPRHLIVLEVREVVDLTPGHMRSGRRANG